MKLKEYLEKEKISVNSFSKKLGVESASLWSFMKGTKRAGPKMAKKISEATNGIVSVEEIRPILEKCLCPTCGKIMPRRKLVTKKPLEKTETVSIFLGE